MTSLKGCCSAGRATFHMQLRVNVYVETENPSSGVQQFFSFEVRPDNYLPEAPRCFGRIDNARGTVRHTALKAMKYVLGA
jgi:hypothetical protein